MSSSEIQTQTVEFGDSIVPTAEVALDSREVTQGRDKDPVLVYLSSLSKGSRRTVETSLNIVSGLLSGGRYNAMRMDWTGIRYQHMAAIRSAVSEVYAPSTANKILSSVKGVMRECKRLGYITPDVLSEICDVSSVKGSRVAKGRALSRGELISVLRVCSSDENQVRGSRDHSIVLLMYSSGLRRSEVVALDTRDLGDRLSTMTISSSKGNVERSVPVNASTNRSLIHWLGHISDISGPLFRPISKSGNILKRRMTDQGVLYVLQRRAREAGVESFTPHDLRRTFIGDLLDAGADISTVQQLAGHANVQTTAQYDRRGEQAKRKATSLLELSED